MDAQDTQDAQGKIGKRLPIKAFERMFGSLWFIFKRWYIPYSVLFVSSLTALAKSLAVSLNLTERILEHVVHFKKMVILYIYV